MRRKELSGSQDKAMKNRKAEYEQALEQMGREESPPVDPVFAVGILTGRVIKMRNKRMWGEKKSFCKRLVLINKRKIRGILYLVLSVSLFLMGCGREESKVLEAEIQEEFELQETGEKMEDVEVSEETDEPEADITKEMMPAIKELPVDFPFNEADSYSLTLAQLKEPDGEYEMRLYDENGKVLQAIPCGVLAEPLQFSFDDLTNRGSCLQIYSADSDTGLLFEWNSEEGKFSEEAIEIPKYIEHQEDTMFTVKETDAMQVKKIYQLNYTQKCVELIRSWKLQKDTGKLEIWDELEQRSLFDGIVKVDKEGNPQNKKYYDLLFREDCYYLWDYKENSIMRICLGDGPEEGTDISQGFFKIQRELFGEDAYEAEYENTEGFLADFGVENDIPVYQYYDPYGNLQLELYKDGSLEQFLGIVYEYNFDSEKKKRMKAYGFTINDVQKEIWTGKDIFSAKSVFGEDIAEYISDPEVAIEYTSSGQIDHYCCKRMTEREVDGEIKDTMCTALEMDYIYRDDGTLYCRDYWHDPYLFSTTLSSLRSFYDEEGRIIFETGYITHGSQEYYYIYDDGKNIPEYCLCIDHNMGFAVPEMVRYEGAAK